MFVLLVEIKKGLHHCAACCLRRKRNPLWLFSYAAHGVLIELVEYCVMTSFSDAANLYKFILDAF